MPVLRQVEMLKTFFVMFARLSNRGFLTMIEAL
jgi:hypothetical protein